MDDFNQPFNGNEVHEDETKTTNETANFSITANPFKSDNYMTSDFFRQTISHNDAYQGYLKVSYAVGALSGVMDRATTNYSQRFSESRCNEVFKKVNNDIEGLGIGKLENDHNLKHTEYKKITDLSNLQYSFNTTGEAGTISCNYSIDSIDFGKSKSYKDLTSWRSKTLADLGNDEKVKITYTVNHVKFEKEVKASEITFKENAFTADKNLKEASINYRDNGKHSLHMIEKNEKVIERYWKSDPDLANIKQIIPGHNGEPQYVVMIKNGKLKRLPITEKQKNAIMARKIVQQQRKREDYSNRATRTHKKGLTHYRKKILGNYDLTRGIYQVKMGKELVRSGVYFAKKLHNAKVPSSVRKTVKTSANNLVIKKGWNETKWYKGINQASNAKKEVKAKKDNVKRYRHNKNYRKSVHKGWRQKGFDKLSKTKIGQSKFGNFVNIQYQRFNKVKELSSGVVSRFQNAIAKVFRPFDFISNFIKKSVKLLISVISIFLISVIMVGMIPILFKEITAFNDDNTFDGYDAVEYMKKEIINTAEGGGDLAAKIKASVASVHSKYLDENGQPIVFSDVTKKNSYFIDATTGKYISSANAAQIKEIMSIAELYFSERGDDIQDNPEAYESYIKALYKESHKVSSPTIIGPYYHTENEKQGCNNWGTFSHTREQIIAGECWDHADIPTHQGNLYKYVLYNNNEGKAVLKNGKYRYYEDTPNIGMSGQGSSPITFSGVGESNAVIATEDSIIVDCNDYAVVPGAKKTLIYDGAAPDKKNKDKIKPIGYKILVYCQEYDLANAICRCHEGCRGHVDSEICCTVNNFYTTNGEINMDKETSLLAAATRVDEELNIKSGIYNNDELVIDDYFSENVIDDLEEYLEIDWNSEYDISAGMEVCASGDLSAADTSNWLSAVQAVGDYYCVHVAEYNQGNSSCITLPNGVITSSRHDCSGYVSTCLAAYFGQNFGMPCSANYGDLNSSIAQSLYAIGFTPIAIDGSYYPVPGDIVTKPGHHVEIIGAVDDTSGAVPVYSWGRVYQSLPSASGGRNVRWHINQGYTIAWRLTNDTMHPESTGTSNPTHYQ